MSDLDDLLPPPLDYSEPSESEPQTALPNLPPLSVPASSPITRSKTLASLRGPIPETACANCPKALWHQTAGGDVRVFCKIMHVLVDELLLECDGTAPAPK